MGEVLPDAPKDDGSDIEGTIRVPITSEHRAEPMTGETIPDVYSALQELEDMLRAALRHGWDAKDLVIRSSLADMRHHHKRIFDLAEQEPNIAAEREARVIAEGCYEGQADRSADLQQELAEEREARGKAEQDLFLAGKKIVALTGELAELRDNLKAAEAAGIYPSRDVQVELDALRKRVKVLEGTLAYYADCKSSWLLKTAKPAIEVLAADLQNVCLGGDEPTLADEARFIRGERGRQMDANGPMRQPWQEVEGVRKALDVLRQTLNRVADERDSLLAEVERLNAGLEALSDQIKCRKLQLETEWQEADQLIAKAEKEERLGDEKK